MNPELISLHELSVGYNGRAVLSNVSLTLKHGSFTGLLGQNGSGKSTLIKTILGLLPPLAGRVILHPQNGIPPVLGYVPQRETLDPIYLFSSFEVALMGTCGRVGPGRMIVKEERDWVHHCLAQTGADALGHKRFSQLSGGQRQRVLIARALAAKPHFLLLDEPTAGIDAAASASIMDLLKDLHQQQQLTFLMVNHDLASVRRTAEEVIWLHGGNVLQGPVSELLSRKKIEEVMELELH